MYFIFEFSQNFPSSFANGPRSIRHGFPGDFTHQIIDKQFNIDILFRIRSDNAWLTVAYTRSKFTPWPRKGGQSGSSNDILIRRANGETERYAVVSGLEHTTNNENGPVLYPNPGHAERNSLSYKFIFSGG